MANKRKLTDEQRKRIREQATTETKGKLSQLAQEYGVSRMTIHRVIKESEQMAHEIAKAKVSYGEFGTGGVVRYGGSIQEDYDRNWRSLQDAVNIIKEMLDFPTIAAAMFAIEMSVRGADWAVTPYGPDSTDKEIAEFVEGCLDDMSHTWDDHITQAVTMIPYGFSLFEMVYKQRLGNDVDPSSIFDDGRIGWRKFAFRPQDSLAPGDEWVFDDTGGIRGVNQVIVPSGRKVSIPIEKLILYRTTAAKNNPQGRSMIRAAYRSWYAAKNFMEIEAIAGERMGAGVPVVYLGKGTRLGGTDSDFERAKKVVRDLRSDEQGGVVFPYAAQEYTQDGTGVHFKLVSPPARGLINFHEVINRYKQEIAQMLMAQFVFFGLTERGSQALAVRMTDFFTSAVAAWLKTLSETFNRHAVPRLIKLNAFTGYDGFPEVKVENIAKSDVLRSIWSFGLAADKGLIEMDESAERAVRQLLGLPQRGTPEAGKPLIELRPPQPNQGNTSQQDPSRVATAGGEPQFGGTEPQTQQPTGGPDLSAWMAHQVERMADKRVRGPKDWLAITNGYQRSLEDLYSQWAEELAEELAEAPTDEDRLGMIEDALFILATRMEDAANDVVSEALAAGIEGAYPDEDLLRLAFTRINENNNYMRWSLIPAIRTALVSRFYADPTLLAGGAPAIQSVLDSFTARVAMYAGLSWVLMNTAAGKRAEQKDQGIAWDLDPGAKHCSTCPSLAKEYASWKDLLTRTGGIIPGVGTECGSNCRCRLRPLTEENASKIQRSETFVVQPQVDVHVSVPRQEPPVVNVTPQAGAPHVDVHVPQPNVTVQVPRLKVDVHVPEQPPPTVEVHVPKQAPPKVDVHMPQQKVDIITPAPTVNVMLPETVEEETIIKERDEEGLLKRVIKRFTYRKGEK